MEYRFGTAYTTDEINILLECINEGAKVSDILKTGLLKRTPSAIEHLYHKYIKIKDGVKWKKVLTKTQKSILMDAMSKNKLWNKHEEEVLKLIIKCGINEYVEIDKNRWIERKSLSAIKRRIIYDRMSLVSQYGSLDKIPIDESLIDSKVKNQISKFVDEKKDVAQIDDKKKKAIAKCIEMGALMCDLSYMKAFANLTRGQLHYNYYKIKRQRQRNEK